ncbi:MAG: hypothetical protein ACYCTL_12300 [Acidimicrobiales bacterium]
MTQRHVGHDVGGLQVRDPGEMGSGSLDELARLREATFNEGIAALKWRRRSMRRCREAEAIVMGWGDVA